MEKSNQSIKQMLELEVISDPKVITMLSEPIRAKLLFTYLSNRPMSIDELAGVFNKKEDIIDYHLRKLKNAGLVVLDRVEVDEFGKKRKYFRASARDYRLGISGMLKLGGGLASFTNERLKSLLTNLKVYGIEIPNPQMDEAVALLKQLVERENLLTSQMYIFDKPKYMGLQSPIQKQVSQLMRRFVLEDDVKYKKIREQWWKFLTSHRTKIRSASI